MQEQENKLITEFMGLKKREYWLNFMTGRYIVKETKFTKIDSEMLFVKNNKPVLILKYHSSYDWLMPVVDKIEEMDVVASFQIEQPTIYIWASSESSTFEDIEIDIFTKSKIEAVYEACVKFIKWYNKQK